MLTYFCIIINYRSIDDDRKSRHSGENGRESGYGTAPSRLWNSPRLIPRFKYVFFHACSLLFLFFNDTTLPLRINKTSLIMVTVSSEQA